MNKKILLIVEGEADEVKFLKSVNFNNIGELDFCVFVPKTYFDKIIKTIIKVEFMNESEILRVFPVAQ